MLAYGAVQQKDKNRKGVCNMSKVVIFLADGHEECEALIPADLLRRAGVEVVLASITGSLAVTGSHGIHVTADALAEEVDYNTVDLLFLPGGLPGTTHLGENALVCEKIRAFAAEGKKVSAICAAPSVLAAQGLLEGKNATSHPGFEDKLAGAKVTGHPVDVDGNITTGRGLGAAIPFGLSLVAQLVDQATADKIAAAIAYKE